MLNPLNGSGFVGKGKPSEDCGCIVYVALPALVYGTAFIHWELDFFFFSKLSFYNKHLYK